MTAWSAAGWKRFWVDFSALSAGSETVTVKGNNYTIEWNISPMDVDGDMLPESNVMEVQVIVKELEELHALKTIVVDNQGSIGKIS